jgi:hypothetical protein
MDTELKRKLFLEKLEGSFRKIEKFEKFSGQGLIRKIKRLFFSPNIHITYLWYRFNPIKKREIRLFWGKTINIIFKDKPPFFSITGILPSEAEYKLTKFFIKNLKEDDIFYDVGANYGFYTYLALELGEIKLLYRIKRLKQRYIYRQRADSMHRLVLLSSKKQLINIIINFQKV